MPDYYFNKFPVIGYANNSVRNISERVILLHNKVIGSGDNYYPVALQGGVETRPDIVADKLYGDAFRDWLLWLGNITVDPYYNWFLSDDEFDAMIIDKYGSIEFAEQATSYWRTVWPSEGPAAQHLTVDFYNNHLPGSWAKYFQPVYNPSTNVILYYVQGWYDWRVSTNQLVSYNYAGDALAVGNVVQFTSGPSVVGVAQVVTCNNTNLVVNHVANNVMSTPLGVVDVFDATSTGVVTNASSLVISIPTSEIVFWEPVTLYTMEEEFNAYRRFVQVIDGSQAMSLSTSITNLLRKQ